MTDVERMPVRFTVDVGAIVGVDGQDYILHKDDVVTLPTANAEPLLETGAVVTLGASHTEARAVAGPEPATEHITVASASEHIDSSPKTGR